MERTVTPGVHVHPRIFIFLLEKNIIFMTEYLTEFEKSDLNIKMGVNWEEIGKKQYNQNDANNKKNMS